MLLGERGQGKTRLIRASPHLLDEWTPVVGGRDQRPPARADLRLLPAAAGRAGRRAAGGLAPPARSGEKLATPDTSVGDLIGDIDPIKVAEGRTLGDPETVHYGLVPAPTAASSASTSCPTWPSGSRWRCSCSEERDIQVRGYQPRPPLDLILIASANPED